jgi:hypothetical protein
MELAPELASEIEPATTLNAAPAVRTMFVPAVRRTARSAATVFARVTLSVEAPPTVSVTAPAIESVLEPPICVRLVSRHGLRVVDSDRRGAAPERDRARLRPGLNRRLEVPLDRHDLVALRALHEPREVAGRPLEDELRGSHAILEEGLLLTGAPVEHNDEVAPAEDVDVRVAAEGLVRERAGAPRAGGPVRDIGIALVEPHADIRMEFRDRVVPVLRAEHAADREGPDRLGLEYAGDEDADPPELLGVDVLDDLAEDHVVASTEGVRHWALRSPA